MYIVYDSILPYPPPFKAGHIAYVFRAARILVVDAEYAERGSDAE